MLGMVSEKDSCNLEKVTTMMNTSNRVLEVRQDEILEIERSLGMIQMMTEEASDLLDKLDLGSLHEPSPMKHGSHNNQVLQALVAKQDNIKVRSGFVLLKVRDMIHKGSAEDVTSLNHREPSTVDVPRGPNTKLEKFPSEGGNIGTIVKASPFDISSPLSGDKLPLKYIKTGDNTKAPFQKPSTIYAPTPVKAQLSMESKGLLISSLPKVATGMMSNTSPPSPVSGSPKKRPRRDRNRARSKGPVMPEPVIQRLLPGDTNKIPEDGYLWRKYGNKSIKTASFKRGYYKCRHFKELRCNALKRVQQNNEDPTAFTVYYIREHTCRQQPDNNIGGFTSCNAPQGALPLSFDEFKKEVDMDEVDIDWASGEDDTSNSAGRGDEPELFRPSEDVAGDTTTGSELSSGASALFDMPTVVGSQPWSEPVSTMAVDTTHYNKIKLESCPPNGQEESLMDDDMQLLKFIQFGDGNLWSDPMNDLSYWVTSGTEFDSFHDFCGENTETFEQRRLTTQSLD